MKCSYCSKEIKGGTGLLYVFKNGKISYFCSNKCYINSIVLRRKPNPKMVKSLSVDTSRIIKPETATESKEEPKAEPKVEPKAESKA